MTIYNESTKNYTISGECNYAWSASQNVFYLISDLLLYIRNNNWPDDAVEVSDEVFTEYASFQNDDGMIRGVGENGMPAWVKPPEPSKDELIKDAESKRSSLIAKSSLEIDMLTDAESDGSITEDEKTALERWKGYRLELRRLDVNNAPDITWPVVPDSN
ncbi:tail fiber assembly protein [Salmonella enterica]|nr:tail fiber assembly protein [Salmonella enterica]